VVRLPIGFHRGHQPRRFIAGRLQPPTMERRQGRGQERIPHDVITGLSQLFRKNAMALRGHREEAQTTGTRFVLGHRQGFTGPGLGPACGFIVALGP
jgi:hypothetical protein